MTDNLKQVAFSIAIDFTKGYRVPTYNCKNKAWEYTTFYSFREFKEFIGNHIKEPGEYEFDNDYLIVQQQAQKWLDTGVYSNFPLKSRDFINFWDNEREKCQKGIIIKSTTGKSWYVTREYYMWLNYLPIFHKEKRKTLFPDLYDGQYHIALCEFHAELEGEHVVLLKKRQYAMSYYHMAKLINQIWFEENVTLKLLSYLATYIGIEGDWSFLNEYRDFLNDNTAWYRPFEPDKTGLWQQRYEATVNGRKGFLGRKGKLMGITTKDSATKGVGGASRFIVVEESGINPTLHTTYGYAKAALEAGPLITVGQFIAYGSVGDLKQCEPLKRFMLNPKDNGFYSRPTRFMDETQGIKDAGLFIPEVWNMLGFSDKYGNSDVQGAIDYLVKVDRPEKKKRLNAEEYQLEVSQHPIYIEEAFSVRGEPIFPRQLVTSQKRKIERGEFPVEHVYLQMNMTTGKLMQVESNKLPISEFPVNMKMEDKTGIICVYERPIASAPWGTYYASVDPVSEGSTTTSDSLCSIIVYRNDIEVTKLNENSGGVPTTHLEEGRIVCTWTGRFNDINKTHERLEQIIEYYNAWTLVEANVSLFIQHMINKKKQKYLVMKDEIPFLKELKSNMNAHQDYGWKNTGSLFKNHLLSYGIEFLKEELEKDLDEQGNVIRITRFGVDRIPDKMILEEMEQYQHGLNVDRLVAYCALIAFVHVQNSNRNILRKAQIKDNGDLGNIKNNGKLFREPVSPFNNFGKMNSGFTSKIRRGGFKNYK